MTEIAVSQEPEQGGIPTNEESFRHRKSMPVIVTGMHRSGTSLVASVIQKAGVNIGDRLIGPSAGNWRGHFEDSDLNAFHEGMLGRRGCNFLVEDARLLSAPTPEETIEAQNLIRQREGCTLWGWKDPRTALFLDFWSTLLPDASYVFVYRHPIEVILSLLRRNELFDSAVVARPLVGLHTWRVHNQFILDFYLRNRHRALLSHISSITSDAEGFVQQAASKLGLPLQSAGAADLYHADELARVAFPAAGEDILAHIAPQEMELYKRLEDCADLPGHNFPADQLASDASRARFRELLSQEGLKATSDEKCETVLELLLDAVAPDVLQAGKNLVIQRQSAQIDDLKNQIRSLAEHNQAVTQDHNQQVAALRAMFEERKKASSRAEEYAASLKDALDEAQRNIDAIVTDRDRQVRSLRGALAERKSELSRAQEPIEQLRLGQQGGSSDLTKRGCPLAMCTIISKNYLAQARCLVNSFLDHHPDGKAFVLLVDRVDSCFDPRQERFVTVLVEDLKIPDFSAFSFRYSIVELNTAVKPFFLEYLFENYDLDKLCYFDPDIVIYEKLDELSVKLGQYGIVLTPHITNFLEDARKPNELHILQAGAYNLGFIGLSKHKELGPFLKWWQTKLLRFCTTEISQGLFVDQRWIDLVPSLFSNVYLLRDPGYNVAYWNLPHRRVAKDKDGYRINGSSLKFFHFSGFSPENSHELSKHQDRLGFGSIGDGEALFRDYCNRLRSEGYSESRSWPYAYGVFEDGVTIPDFARWIWRETDENGRRWPNPFAATGVDLFRDWLNQSVDPDQKQSLITRLAMHIYKRRADLQRVFPDVRGADRLAFVNWLLTDGKEQHALDEYFLLPIRESLVGLGNHRPFPAGAGVGVLASHPPTRLSRWVSRFNYTRIGKFFKRLMGRRLLFFVKRRILGIEPIRQDVGPIRTAGVSSSRPSAPIIAENLSTARSGLNVVGYVRSETGVGEAARSSLRALLKHNYPVTLTSIQTNDLSRKEDWSYHDVPEGHPYDINLLHVNADQVPAVREELGHGFFAGKYNIAFWFWELSSFPEIWMDRFKLFHEIWVASTFTQSALAAVSPIPVVRMRPAVETEPAVGITRQTMGLPGDKFIFLFAFDMFSICERKNPYGLIEAYRRAFEPDFRDTVLVIKVTNLQRARGLEMALGLEPNFQAKLAESVRSVSGLLLDGYLDRKSTNALYNLTDSFVSLHRSEGFGLSIAEAMHLGKPCIATGYSSNMDFMTPYNSYLTRYRLVELRRDYGPYKQGTVWADPDLDHAASLMRRVAKDRQEAIRVGGSAAADIRSYYSSEVAGQEMINRLELIRRSRGSI